VEGKDGGRGLLGRDDGGLLKFKADGRCNGIELFRGREFGGLSGRWLLLFVALWKRLEIERTS
jgi:hypothetical protein